MWGDYIHLLDAHVIVEYTTLLDCSVDKSAKPVGYLLSDRQRVPIHTNTRIGLGVQYSRYTQFLLKEQPGFEFFEQYM